MSTVHTCIHWKICMFILSLLLHCIHGTSFSTQDASVVTLFAKVNTWATLINSYWPLLVSAAMGFSATGMGFHRNQLKLLVFPGRWLRHVLEMPLARWEVALGSKSLIVICLISWSARNHYNILIYCICMSHISLFCQGRQDIAGLQNLYICPPNVHLIPRVYDSPSNAAFLRETLNNWPMDHKFSRCDHELRVHDHVTLPCCDSGAHRDGSADSGAIDYRSLLHLCLEAMRRQKYRVVRFKHETSKAKHTCLWHFMSIYVYV